MGSCESKTKQGKNGDRPDGIMSTAPALDSTLSPTAPASADLLSVERGSRSILRNLFSRRRLSPNPSIITSGSVADTKAAHLETSSSERHGFFTQTKALPSLKPHIGLSGGSHQQELNTRLDLKHPQTSSPADSRQFYHAYSRAPLRSCLQTPSKGLLSRLPSSPILRPPTATLDATPGNSRSGSPHGPELYCADAPLPSGTPSGSFTDKIFVLEHSGTLLQFKVDGAPDRMPEKIVQLTTDSTVLPSDAVAGQSLALEITVGNNTNIDQRPKTNRSMWTINPFRASMSRRSAETIVMVFDNADLMATWLCAIRKEIEACSTPTGRPQSSRSHIDKQLPMLRTASTERFSLRQSFLHLSRSSSSLRAEYVNPTDVSKELPNLPLPPTYRRTTSSRSVAASSVGTTTSLDRFRECDNTSTTTAATNSLDGSFTLDSPVKESFASIASPLLDPVSSPLSESHTCEAPSSSAKSIRERRKSSNGQSRSASSSTAETISRPPTTEHQPNIKADMSATFGQDDQSPATLRPLSFLPPLPGADDMRRPLPLPRTMSVDCVDTVAQPKITRPASSHAGHRPKPSTDSNGKSMYSLFPKKRIDQPKAEPLIVPEQNHIPGLSQNHATDHLELPPTPTVSVTPAMPQAKPKPLTKKPCALKLLAPFDIDQAQRSPAVTDDMLNSNFGTLMANPPLSPTSPKETCVPSFDDLKFDFSFLRQNDSRSRQRRSNSPSSDHSESSLRRQRSAPSFRISRPPGGPVGPPPTGPLPAVPHGDNATSSPPSPPEKRAGERPKSSRAGNSPPRPPSAFHKQKPPTPSLKIVPITRNSNDTAKDKPLPEPHSPLTSVGMPSIITPITAAPRIHERQGSSNKSIAVTQSHRRDKSSGKYSIGGNIKGFPSAPMLCS